MEYEFINPSDRYTFIAADYETAVLAVFCLGPAYGAKPKDDGEDVPIFIFGGAVEPWNGTRKSSGTARMMASTQKGMPWRTRLPL